MGFNGWTDRRIFVISTQCINFMAWGNISLNLLHALPPQQYTLLIHFRWVCKKRNTCCSRCPFFLAWHNHKGGPIDGRSIQNWRRITMCSMCCWERGEGCAMSSSTSSLLLLLLFFALLYSARSRVLWSASLTLEWLPTSARLLFGQQQNKKS